MSQRQRDRDFVITDIIQELMKPEPHFEPKPHWSDKIVMSIWSWLFVIVLGATGITWTALSLVNLSWMKEIDFNPLYLILAGLISSGLALLAYNIMGSLRIRWAILLKQAQDERFELQKTRTAQRTALLQALGPVEIAASAYRSQYTAQDLANAQRREERDHELRREGQAQEADIRKIKAQAKENRKVLEAQLKVNHPTADQKAFETQVNMGTKIALYTLVNRLAESNDTNTQLLAQQLMDDLQRGRL